MLNEKQPVEGHQGQQGLLCWPYKKIELSENFLLII